MTETGNSVDDTDRDKRELVELACETIAKKDIRYVPTAEIARHADLSTYSVGMVLAQSRDKFTKVAVEKIEQGIWSLDPETDRPD